MQILRRTARRIVLLSAVVLGVVGVVGCASQSTVTSASPSLCQWGNPFHPSKPFSLGYSLYQATYWTFGFDETAATSHLAIHFTGQFPYARYLSFVAYDETGATVAQLFDAQITPQPGSVNPYQVGVDRASPNRSYEAWLVHTGSPRAGQPSTLVIPAQVKTMFLVLRLFVPDQGRSFDGGVPAPQIEAINDQTGQPATCPASHFLPATGVFDPIKGDDNITGTTIDTYHGIGSLLGQGDGSNPYAFVILRTDLGPAAMLRWHAPTTPRTTPGGGTFTGQEQLRYWSLCLASRLTTAVSQCLIDEEVTPSADGFVTLVLGPGSLASAAQSHGWTFLSWDALPKPMLILREVLPNSSFTDSFTSVPPIDMNHITAQAILQNRGSLFIGDYAPQGVYCSLQAIQNNTCLPAATPNGEGASAR